MHKINVFVPDSRANVTDVRQKLDTLRWMAGGQTAAKVEGSWIGERGLEVEPVTIVSFLIEDNSTKLEIFRAHVNHLAEILKANGEECVLIEEFEVNARFV